MDLGMFDKFCPNLKPRTQLEEIRIDMRRSYKNCERYVIHMHRKYFWTNKWMQDPRRNFLQVSYCDPSAQYKKGWGSFKRKRGLNLVTFVEDRDTLLRNSLVEDIVVFVVKLWTMKF